MGASMASHLLSAGHSVAISTRTPAKAASLLNAGATWAETPALAAERAEIICIMVGYPRDVRTVVLGQSGVLQTASEGSTIIDFTTSEPALAVEIAEAAAERGVGSIDAPVSGGDIGARNATLSIMVGGSDADVARAQPLLDLLGSTVVHQGPAGSGQHTKMVNQILIATGMIGVSEALLYAYRAGLDPETVLSSVSGGAAGSWALSNLAPRVVQGDFEPGFYVEHFIKDMRIALDESERMGLSMPGLALAHQLYVALAAQGGSRKGTQALIQALATMSDVELPVS
jgi:3-hydroxyisobutyrate dehydrogenase